MIDFTHDDFTTNKKSYFTEDTNLHADADTLSFLRLFARQYAS